MKRILILLAVCLWTAPVVYAQSGDGTSYLFEQFQKGRVYYKDGKQFEVLLNLDVSGPRFLFVDGENNIMEFGEPEKVTMVHVGDRTFMHDPKGIREILQTEPPLSVEYRTDVVDRGRNAGYGTRSTTSSTTRYTSIESDGIYQKFSMEEQYAVGDIKKIYTTEINRKVKRFEGEKDFLKLYPDRKEVIKKYIEDNSIDFNSVEQVVRLCNYAATL